MNLLKKSIAYVVAIAMVCTLYAPALAVDKKYNIITTSFHEFDWVRNIVGENNPKFNIDYIVSSGMDIHSFQPTIADIITISTADIFISNGGMSDQWVQDALAQSVNKNQQNIKIMDILGEHVIEELSIEGAQATEHNHCCHGHKENHEHEDHEHEDHEHEDHEHEDHEHEDHEHEDHEHEHHEHEDHEHEDHEHENHEHEDHEHEDHNHCEETCTDLSHNHSDAHADEHVWLSLKNAIIACKSIEQAIIALDPENTLDYSKNTLAYIEKLDALNKKYESELKAVQNNVLIFADRFPFAYLTEEYNLDVYAAFNGCHAESEASFETILFLANKLDETAINTLITIDGADDSLANTVKNTSSSGKDAKVLMLNSMESTTKEDVANGATYISIMENNLQTILKALS